MKQSERMRMYRSYYENPLRKQYEAEKRELRSASPLLVFCYFVLVILFILSFVYGYLFLGDNEIFGAETFLVALVFGIVNLLLACVIVLALVNDNKEKQFECSKLREKYEEQGLYEVENPCREPCGERDYDGDWVCSVTGNLLSWQEFAWCQVKGNCMHCSKFVTAFFGADALENWNYEIQK